MKYLAIIMMIFSSINLFGQDRSFNTIPKNILEQLDKMGVEASPLLNSYESAFLNVIFKESLKGYDFTKKKVGFIKISSEKGKIHYFDMQKRHFVDEKHPCDNGTLYIFDSTQKEESGGYDAAIVYWSKLLIPVEKVVKRLKEKPTEMCDNVFFYITTRTDKSKKDSREYPLTLLIDNQSKDTVRIEHFNKHIFYKYDGFGNNKPFYWEFLTTANRVPDDIVIVSGVSKKQAIGENTEIVIPPDSTFVSDIYIQYSNTFRHRNGYYKLCLYYEKCSRCVAELLVKKE